MFHLVREREREDTSVRRSRWRMGLAEVESVRLAGMVLLGCGVAFAPMMASAEPFAVFDVSVVFADGNQLTGTVSLTDKNALFLTEDLTYQAGATVLATYTGQGELIPFLPPMGSPAPGPTTTAVVSPGPAGNPYEIGLILPTGQIADWAGGSVCLVDSGCSNGLYTTATTTEPSPYGGTEYVTEPAVSGSFVREGAASPVPEPTELTLLATGLLAGAAAVRRQVRHA